MGHKRTGVSDVKDAFIRSAREIVRAEGRDAASARTIAERAGYSYATLYNYFNDRDDLLACVCRCFLEECRDFVFENAVGCDEDEKRIYEVARWYALYFVQYPSIFSLMYSDSLCYQPDKRHGDIDFFDSLIQLPLWTSRNEYIRYKYALHGLLLFSLNQKETLDYQVFINALNSISL